MAGAGTSSIITLAVIALGAVLLGVLFGQLTKRVPNVDGGLYAYARHEFGDFAGYLTAWCYWITCWAGNAAIVVVVGPLRRVPVRHREPLGAGPTSGIALTGLWIPAVVNLAGVRQMAWFQNVTVVLKFVPLLFVGIVRLVLRDSRQLRAVQRLGRQPLRRASTWRPAWPSSRSSASSAPRSPPAGSRTPAATSAGPR